MSVYYQSLQLASTVIVISVLHCIVGGLYFCDANKSTVELSIDTFKTCCHVCVVFFSVTSNSTAETSSRQALGYDDFQKFQNFRRSKEQERRGHFTISKRRKTEQVSVS